MRITSALWHSNTHLGHLFLFLDNVLNVSPSQSIFVGVCTCRILQDIVDGMHTLLRFGNKNVRADIGPADPRLPRLRSEEHTSELQSPDHLVCRLLLEKKKIIQQPPSD